MSEISDKIKKAEKYGIEDFLDFIDENKLLKGYVNINNFKDMGATREEPFFKLAFNVIRRLEKDKYKEWCSNIEILAMKNLSFSSSSPCNNREMEYYLAFCMSDRDKLTQALYAIHCPKKKKVKKDNIWDLVEI